MKRFHFSPASLALLSALVLCRPGATSTKTVQKPVAPKPLNVAFLTYNGVELLDFSGPMDVFVTANSIAPKSYNVFTVSIEDGLILTEQSGVTIKAKYTIRNNPRPDIIVIPGAAMDRIQEIAGCRTFTEWLTKEAGRSKRVLTVCTGAFLLAKTKALNGRKSTTHWFTLDSYQRQFPQTTAIQGARFVEDGKFITSAGISSGIDGALQLVERTKGKPVADGVARAMQYRRGTPAYPHQTMGKVVLQPASPKKATTANSQSLASKIDPVCGMTVDEMTPFTFAYKGRNYGFCCEHCKTTFAAHPAEYLR